MFVYEHYLKKELENLFCHFKIHLLNMIFKISS